MRFAYIDSQGKEVPIPSVEALQLRIELGAITEDTRFYDASADRWAPAAEHEIFRTLSRDSGGQDDAGFVAPPPPTRGTKRPGAPAPEEEAPREEAPKDDAPLDQALPGKTPPEEDADAAAPPSRPRDPDPFEREQGPADDEPSLDPFDLDIPVDSAPPPDDAPAAGDPAAADDFDFGSFGTIELDDSFTAPPGETPAAAEEVDDDVAHASDDLELEDPLSEQAATDAEPEDGADEDEASGDVGPGEVSDVAPDWLADGVDEMTGEGTGAGTTDAASAAGPAASGETAAADAPHAAAGGGRDRDPREGERGAPAPPPRRGRDDDGSGRAGRRRSRPTPPPRRGKESNVGRIALGVAAVAILAVGGWYLLTLLGNGGEPSPEVAAPVVEIPELPSELAATFEATGAAAYATTLDSLRALGAELPEAPPEAWLGGNYLANASRFPGVRDYWGAVRGYLDRVRSSGEQLFVSLHEVELDSAAVAAGSDRDALVERARAGFQASRPDRSAIFAQLEGLIVAAEGLDDFLRENEASIDYEPAAGGISRDPVVEAVPATEELGEEMWDRVARITAAMDALGAVDRVRSELLLDILFEKLDQTELY